MAYVTPPWHALGMYANRKSRSEGRDKVGPRKSALLQDLVLGILENDASTTAIQGCDARALGAAAA